jgi:pimeloyl-ACP methyl ester carboxylesterase
MVEREPEPESVAVTTDDGVRVILPDAGHLPWVEDPKGFREALATVVS